MRTENLKAKLSGYLHSCSYADILVSAWCASSFVGLGTSMNVFGQTLFDLASHLSIATSSLAPMFTVRAVGHGLGSAVSGPCFDRFHKLSFWQLITIITIAALGNFILPLSVHLAMVGVIMFVQGICFGALDNGVHAILTRIWTNKLGPSMQLIHFAYALGAFLAPLIARPFLSEEGSSNSTNVSCTQLLDMYDSGSGQPLNISSCLAMGVQNCSNASSLEGSAVRVTQIDCPMEPSLRYAWAYWIVTIPLLIPLPAFLFYACRDQCFWKTAKQSTGDGTERSTKEDGNIEPMKLYPDTIPYKIFLFSLLAVFTFLYIGLEVTYGGFIFAYSVNSELNFHKPQAALLASVFWGSFTFFRFFAFPLALCGIPSWVMLSVNVGGGVIGSIVLVVWPVNPTAVWIGSAILGSSMASIFPNIVVWLSEHGPANGKTTGLLIVGATLGDLSLPAAVGYLVTTSSTFALPVFTLAGMLVCAVMLVVLFIVSKLWTQYYLRGRGGGDVSRYNRLQFVEEEEEEAEVEDEQVEMTKLDGDQGFMDLNSDTMQLIKEEDSTAL